MFVCDLKLSKATNNIFYTVRYGLGDKAGEKFSLHADSCNLGSGFLATDYMSFLPMSRYHTPKHETKQA